MKKTVLLCALGLKEGDTFTLTNGKSYKVTRAFRNDANNAMTLQARSTFANRMRVFNTNTRVVIEES